MCKIKIIDMSMKLNVIFFQKYYIESDGSVSGMLDLGSKGRWFESHRRQALRCSFNKTLYPLLCTGSTYSYATVLVM